MWLGEPDPLRTRSRPCWDGFPTTPSRAPTTTQLSLRRVRMGAVLQPDRPGSRGRGPLPPTDRPGSVPDALGAGRPDGHGRRGPRPLLQPSQHRRRQPGCRQRHEPRRLRSSPGPDVGEVDPRPRGNAWIQGVPSGIQGRLAWVEALAHAQTNSRPSLGPRCCALASPHPVDERACHARVRGRSSYRAQGWRRRSLHGHHGAERRRSCAGLPGSLRRWCCRPVARPARAGTARGGEHPGSPAGVGGDRVPDAQRQVLHRQALQPAAALSHDLPARHRRSGRPTAEPVAGRSQGAAASSGHLRPRVFWQHRGWTVRHRSGRERSVGRSVGARGPEAGPAPGQRDRGGLLGGGQRTSDDPRQHRDHGRGAGRDRPPPTARGAST